MDSNLITFLGFLVLGKSSEFNGGGGAEPFSFSGIQNTSAVSLPANLSCTFPWCLAWYLVYMGKERGGLERAPAKQSQLRTPASPPSFIPVSTPNHSPTCRRRGLAYKPFASQIPTQKVQRPYSSWINTTTAPALGARTRKCCYRTDWSPTCIGSADREAWGGRGCSKENAVGGLQCGGGRCHGRPAPSHALEERGMGDVHWSKGMVWAA
jgi:hypothetical protein|mmetsp:Transcript_64782/g.107440  ORF Transcript_64782/g.107440 Transcript_64782/m.107440 type:complete len:210 (+) Transcript_64782:161-790(+)